MPLDMHQLYKFKFLNLGENNFIRDISSTIKNISQVVKLIHANGLIFPEKIGNLFNLGHSDMHFYENFPVRTLAEFKKLKDLIYN